MAGLLETSLNKTDPLKTVQGYDPETIAMDDADSVESRIAKIASSGSDLNTLADTRSKQDQNAKGTLNSSMAIQAGQTAILDRALPIASQDATTASTFKLSNQTAKNTASGFNANQKNQAAGLLETGNQQLRNIDANATAEGELQTDRITQETAAEKTLIGERGRQDYNLQILQGIQDTSLQNLRGDQARDLADIEGRYQLLAQTSESAAIAMSQHSLALGEILGNENIPLEQKQQLVDKQMELMSLQLNFLGASGNVDLAGLLNWNSQNAAGTTTTTTTNNTAANPNSVKPGIDAIQTAYQAQQGNPDQEIDALNSMYQYAVAKNKTVKQLSAELGKSEEVILNNLAKINKTLPLG